jgi:hypothetical protein
VAAEDGVHAAHAAGHLQVDVHAVVAEHHHHLCALAARLVDHLLQVVVLDAEAPVGHHVARVGDRRIREGLADDGHRHAIDRADDVGRKDRVAEVGGLDVLRHEVDLALEVLLDDLLHPLHAVGELPMAGHHVHGQQLARVDHVLRVGPQAGGAALPGVAAVEQQRTRAAGFEHLHQRGQVGKPTHAAIAPRRLLEIQHREGVRLGRPGLQAGSLEQVLAHQVWQLPLHRADTQVDAGLAEPDRLELRVAIGHVQQRDVAEARDVVEGALRLLGVGVGMSAQRHAGHAGGTQHLEELSLAQVHGRSVFADI